MCSKRHLVCVCVCVCVRACVRAASILNNDFSVYFVPRLTLLLSFKITFYFSPCFRAKLRKGQNNVDVKHFLLQSCVCFRYVWHRCLTVRVFIWVCLFNTISFLKPCVFLDQGWMFSLVAWVQWGRWPPVAAGDRSVWPEPVCCTLAAVLCARFPAIRSRHEGGALAQRRSAGRRISRQMPHM